MPDRYLLKPYFLGDPLSAEGRRSLVSQTEHLLAELQSVATPNLSMLAVANRQLKSMSV